MRNPLRLGGAVLLAVIAAAPAVLRAIESVQQPQTQPAQNGSAQPVLPPAAEIMERHIKAIGGREALLSRSSVHAVGKVEMPSAGMSGTLEMFAAKPNKTLLHMSLPGIGEVREGFDGTVGWSLNPLTGPTLIQGTQLEQRKLDSDFYSVVNYDKRYESMTTVEVADFDGRPCYKVRLVRPGGGEDFQFYDVKTGLRAGMITTRETPMGSMTATMTETDYKPFGGVLQPTRLNTKVENLQQVMTFEKFEFDKVDPSVFALPDQIKALLK